MGIQHSAVSAHPLTRRRLLTAGSAAVLATAAAACSAPGSDSGDAGSASVAASATALPTTPVKLRIMTSQEAGDAVRALGTEFTKQFPQVTFEITAEANANLAQNLGRILSREDPPELCFTPSLAQPAKSGLLTNLDPFAELYGWNDWSPEVLGVARQNADGQRGTGSLYAMGIGYNVTGVFYNKQLASKLGLQLPPKTFADFEAACTEAVKQGLKAISLAGKDVGTPYLLQEVQNTFGDVTAIRDWIYNAPGASFKQPAMIKAAAKLQEWIGNGIIGKDAMSVDYPTMMGDFMAGKALFVAVGDWEGQRLSKAMGDNVGFFLMPPEKEGGDVFSMASPANYAIPAKAKNKEASAFFLNWVQTNEVARQLVVDKIGCAPGGPSNLPAPKSDSALVTETTAAFADLLKKNGTVDFIANAPNGLGVTVVVPECQALLVGKSTPEQFVEKIQKAYEADA